MAQERDSHPVESKRDLRVLLPSIVLGAIGIALIVFAILRLTSTLEATSDSGTVTVKCGNAFEARGFETGDPVEIVEGGDDPNAAIVLAGIADDCNEVGTNRIILSAVLGGLGVVALVGAGVLARRPQLLGRFTRS